MEVQRTCSNNGCEDNSNGICKGNVNDDGICDNFKRMYKASFTQSGRYLVKFLTLYDYVCRFWGEYDRYSIWIADGSTFEEAIQDFKKLYPDVEILSIETLEVSIYN